MTKSKLANWFLLIGVAITSFAMVAIPVWLIQPFAPQTDLSIEISFYLRSWSPILTILFSIFALILAILIWRNSRWFAKSALIIPLILIGFSVWFAQQNHFLWMFNPLANSSYVMTNEAKFVKDDDFVMAVDINGESVAYPILQMAYHHVVQDVVGGKPITATY
jgi:thiol:disulfide interchange protein